MDNTIQYYNSNAKTFSRETVNVCFTDIQQRFLEKLPSGATVLDFGCGSGRDSKYFSENGCLVDATDGSEEMCRIAEQTTGKPVRQMLFQELDETNKYDGIWACASILHLGKMELTDVFGRMIRALKMDGFLYVSFKYGQFEGIRNGRYFTDFTEESFSEYIAQFREMQPDECWVSEDVRPGRQEEKWLNIILQKKAMS